jgi:hypothetical protein
MNMVAGPVADRDCASIGACVPWAGATDPDGETVATIPFCADDSGGLRRRLDRELELTLETGRLGCSPLMHAEPESEIEVFSVVGNHSTVTDGRR